MRLFNQGFLSRQWGGNHFKSSMVAIMSWLTITKYQCHKWLHRICTICRSHTPVLFFSLFITGSWFTILRVSRRCKRLTAELLIFRSVRVHPRFLCGLLLLNFYRCSVLWISLRFPIKKIPTWSPQRRSMDWKVRR